MDVSPARRFSIGAGRGGRERCSGRADDSTALTQIQWRCPRKPTPETAEIATSCTFPRKAIACSSVSLSRRMSLRNRLAAQTARMRRARRLPRSLLRRRCVSQAGQSGPDHDLWSGRRSARNPNNALKIVARRAGELDALANIGA